MTSTVLDNKPSKTAIGTAFMRALLSLEADPCLRCRDDMAKLFLPADFAVAITTADKRRQAKAAANKGAYEFMLARTQLIDKLFAEHLRNVTPQIVLLGAGFDTRAWRFNALIAGTKIFELDLPATQRYKRDCLASNNIQLLDDHCFVPTSFNLESLHDDLIDAGYDPAQKTFFIWEGVTHYLTETTVDRTLNFIKEFSAHGSEVIFDYIYREVLDREIVNKDTEILLSWADEAGEPFRFGIPQNGIDDFLGARGLKLIKNYSPSDLERAFLTNSSGKLYGRTTGFYCFAHARI